jgi:hypothetical protein
MVELADKEQRVRAYALAQHGAAVNAALGGRDLDRIAVGDAEPRGGAGVDDHAAMTGDVVGHLVDHLHADVRAPRVLHAARGEQPEREVVGLAAGLADDRLPQRGEVLPDRHRLVFLELRVPPAHVVLVQPASELGADARQPLLVGQLEAQAALDQRRQQVPVDVREGPGREAVLLPPVEAMRLGAIGYLGAGGLADGVPDLFTAVFPLGVEREVAVHAIQRHAARALVDGCVVALAQTGAPCQLGRDVGEVARLAARGDRRLAQCEALVIPEALLVLGAADADQLQAFEVGRLGQQDVGEVIRLVVRVGEGDDEREACHLLADRLRVPERDRRIGAIQEPHVRDGDAGQPLGRFVEEQP